MILSFDIERQDLSLQPEELQIISLDLVIFCTMQKEVLLMDGIQIGDVTIALTSFVGS